MNNKFTPWKSGKIFVENQPEMLAITEKKWGGKVIAIIEGTDETAEKNAALIAAAPDMLDWIEAVIEQGAAQHRAGDNVCTIGKGMMDQAIDIIAKAKGE